MSSDHQFYIPVSIPLWGVAETDHIHINNHVNFVFHAEKGKVVAAASYPGMSHTLNLVKFKFAIVFNLLNQALF